VALAPQAPARHRADLDVLHSDQDYVPAPFPPYALVGDIMWFVDDFTAENPATRIVPLSHRRLRPLNYANVTTNRRRRGILTYYCRPFMRQQENFFLSLDPEVFAPATLRQLLGYEMWLGGVGAIGGLPRNAPRV
jgi:ectoine hydroxylase-related dioxygenase (phytanoyl-CoA dioxygenase family)